MRRKFSKSWACLGGVPLREIVRLWVIVTVDGTLHDGWVGQVGLGDMHCCGWYSRSIDRTHMARIE